MWKVRELADKVTNVVMNYTDIESKVREATNDDPWGPTGTLRHELAQATFSYDQFPEVMGMLWKRIAENKRSPRRIYKSLLLVHHLLLNGSDRVIRAVTDRLYEIRQLQDYHVVYEPGFNLAAIIPVDEYKDGEMNVRVKAKEIVELIQDEERLKEDRKKSKKNRDKYIGIGSERSGSRWNDFDDDLQFPSKNSSSSKYDDFDENSSYDKNSDYKSSAESKKSEFSTSSSSTTNLSEFKSSNNNLTSSSNPHSKYSPKESPKSGLGIIKLNSKIEDDDDFNPRAVESGGDFADFQSAFSTPSPVSSSGAKNELNLELNAKNEPVLDLFGAQNNSEDLLGLDMSSIVSSSTSTIPNFPTSSFSPFQTFSSNAGSIPHNNGMSTSSSSTSAQNVLFDNFMSSSSSSTGGGNNLGGGAMMLQPQQVNNINNNNFQSVTVPSASNPPNKKALEGTTWSDLNISIDDLNLSSKPKVTAQPTMNQLLSSPNNLKPLF